MRGASKFRLATIALFLVYLGVLGAWMALREDLVDGWSLPLVVPAAAAALLALQVARRASERESTERAGWALLGVAAAAWLVGRAATMVAQTTPWGNQVEPVGLAGYFVAPPALLAALILLCVPRPSITSARLVIATATDVGGPAALCWYFVIRPLLETPELGPFERNLALTYLVVDLALLFWAAALYHSHREDAAPGPSLLLAVAVGCLALADVVSFFFLGQLLAGREVRLGWNDAAWGVGFALLATAGVVQLRQSRRVQVAGWQAPPPPEVLAEATYMRVQGVVVPSLFSMAAAALLLWHSYEQSRRLQLDVSTVAFGLVGTMLLRQLLVLAENSRLSERLQTFNRSLEDRVRERTRQLDTLHDIARAANSSLDLDRVLDEVLQRTASLLKADATAFWIVERAPERLDQRPIPSLAAKTLPPPRREGASLRDPSGSGVPVADGEGGESSITYLVLRRQRGFDRGGRHFALETISERWAMGLHALFKERRSVPVPLAGLDAEEMSKESASSAPSLGSRSGLCDALQRAECPPKARSAGPPELMCAPLVWQGRILGVLGAVRWRGRLGEMERGLLEAVALEVAVALQNARLYDTAIQAADRDFVTGLFNHRAVVHRLERELRRADYTGSSLAVLVMDLDNFKLFNDTHGHLMGDQVLKCVAEVLRRSVRPNDIAGRYGGDEFVLVCPDTGVEEARQVAEMIRARLAEAAPFSADGRRLPLSVSCGVAVYPEMARTQHELLAAADANLYDAKLGGQAVVVGGERDQAEVCAPGGFSTLDALVTAVDKRDRYTRRHSQDVTEFSLMIAEELGFSEESKRTVRIAGLLHDLGKIGIPDPILRKPGKLTDEEFEVMKQHPVLGWMIVSAIPSLAETLPGIRHHHERYDGRGYPDGLAGEEIPELGRLMAVADAFSAMTTDRPYRKGMSMEDAVAELRKGRGTQWDPKMVDAFLRALERHREREAQPPEEGATEHLPPSLATHRYGRCASEVREAASCGVQACAG